MCLYGCGCAVLAMIVLNDGLGIDFGKVAGMVMAVALFVGASYDFG